MLALHVQEPLVFPAYAGMIPAGNILKGAIMGVPRIRGDDPSMSKEAMMPQQCSPHTRG